MAAGLVLAVWAYERLYESGARPLLRLAPVRIALVVFLAVCTALLAQAGGQPFYYFQF